MRIFYISAFLLSLLLLILHQQDCFLPFLDNLGRGKLLSENFTFLNESRTEGLETFTLLTGIKTGIALIESSNAGISFIVDVQIQVGKIATALSEMVNYAWAGAFISLGVITSIEILLKLFDNLASPFLYLLLFTGIFHLIFSFFSLKLKNYSYRFLKLAVFFFALSFFIFPVSIYFGAETSKLITKPISKNAKVNLEEHSNFFKMKEEGEGLKEKSQNGISHFLEVSKNLDEKHESLTKNLIDHLVLFLFDLLIFPLFFLYFLSSVFKRALLKY
jgi:hypothetical protein